MDPLIAKTIWIYALTIIVSMVVAGVIRLLTLLTAWMERRSAAAATVQKTARQSHGADLIPEEDVAAIAGALAYHLGAYRILHISPDRHGHGWVDEFRAAQHSSHAPLRHTGRH